MRTRTLLPCVLAALFAAQTALAAPLELSHQGRLLDSAGAPLDGTHSLALALYTAPSGGTPAWSETQSADFDAGFYSVTLGVSTPIDADTFDGSTLYLGLAIDGGAELPDRVAVTSVPYAIRAGSAASVSGGSVDATEIKVGGATIVDSSGKIDFSVLANVPAASEDTDTLGDLTCSADQVARFDGSAWACADAADHDHLASDLTAGTIDVARLPVGTDGASVAAGDHAHTAADVGALSIDGGTLKGPIGLGTSTAKCESSTAGQIRWTGAAFEGCDGKAWATLVAQSELPGLVVHYDAANTASYGGSGTTWKDLSGHGVNGAMGSCLSWGKLGGVDTMIFNRTACSSVKFRNAALNPDAMTAIYWVYSRLLTSNNGGGGLYVNRPDTSVNDGRWVWFGKYSDDTWYFRVNNGSGCCQDMSGSGSTSPSWSSKVPNGKWTMVHFAFQNGGTWKWGANGTNAVSTTLDYRPSTQWDPTSTIGYGHSGAGEYWDGGISSVKFYDRLLSDAEIKAVFEATKGNYGL